MPQLHRTPHDPGAGPDQASNASIASVLTCWPWHAVLHPSGAIHQGGAHAAAGTNVSMWDEKWLERFPDGHGPGGKPPDNCTIHVVNSYEGLAEVLTSGWETCAALALWHSSLSYGEVISLTHKNCICTWERACVPQAVTLRVWLAASMQLAAQLPPALPGSASCRATVFDQPCGRKGTMTVKQELARPWLVVQLGLE